MQKWMGGWSEEDLAICSTDKFAEIVKMINEEQEEMARISNR